MSNSPQDVYKKVLGQKGEKLVEKYIKKAGYVVLHRNFRTPFGEADIIASDGDEVVFIEVKTRIGDSFGLPREAVDTQKQNRYQKIARYYWVQTGKEPNARFDIAEVYEGKRIEYYKNAF